MILFHALLFLLLFSGSLLIMFAALGVIRFVDPLCRSHALGKASSLGISLILGGLWMALDDEISGLKILLVMVFSLLTIPMSSHLVSLYVYDLQDQEITLRPGDAPDSKTGNCGPGVQPNSKDSDIVEPEDTGPGAKT